MTLHPPTITNSPLQRARSWGMNQLAGLMNLVNRVSYPYPERPNGFRDHVRWFLEARLETVFGWLWAGSDDEVRAVYNSEVPIKLMSARQRAVLTEPPSHYTAHCVHCDWRGTWDQCHLYDCPECGEAVYLDPLEFETGGNP